MKTWAGVFLIGYMMSAFVPTSAEPVFYYLGDCYPLYECQGPSYGVFDDVSCKNMGGHSMKDGAVCIDL